MALNFKGMASLLVKPKVVDIPPPPPPPKPVAKAPVQAAKPLKSAGGTNTSPPPKSEYKPFVPFNYALPEDEYTILHALKELFEGREGTLMLVNKSTGIGYKVTGVFEEDKVGLQGPNGMSFRPKVGLREVSKYTAIWRG